MSTSWYGLLANFAIIAIFVSVWSQGQDWIESWPRPAQAATLAALMGGGAVALMLLHFEIREGVFVDLRTTLIGLSGFVGGPLAGVATGAIAAVFRAALGGAGWLAGVIGIAIATTIGLVGYQLLRGRTPSRSDIVIFAACDAVGGIAGFFFLPRNLWATTIPQVAAPLATMIFVSTVITGIALVNEIRRRETARENLMYRGIIDALPDSLNAKDLTGRFLAANPATAKLMHADGPEALVGRTDFDFYPAETARSFRADEDKVLRGGAPATIEQRLVRDDGSIAWLSTLKAPLRDGSGSIVGLLTHNRDVTDRKRLEDEHTASQERLADALAHMADALVMFDRDDRLVFCNEQYRALFPKTADLRVPGARLRDILRASLDRGEQAGVAPEDADAWIEGLCASLRVVGDREIELKDGRWLHTRVRPTKEGASLSLISDVTRDKLAEKKLSEPNERLEELARTDGLTGLVNRRAFDETLKKEFLRSARTKAPLSLLLIDVDRFKAFNDSYGHPAGDDCLRAVGGVLMRGLRRPADVAARYGGEEFAAILPDTKPDGAFVIAEAFRTAVRDLQMPHSGSEKGVVTVSVGVSTFGWGGSIDRSDQLVGRADEALYGAKAAGRDRVHGSRPRLTPLPEPTSAAGA